MLEDTIGHIKPADREAEEQARARERTLTKPPGSLGRLEDLAVRIAGIMGNPTPSIEEGVVFVMAADHGVASSGVSAYPMEVTRQMVMNFLSGGAAINALAEYSDMRVAVTDCGVAAMFPPHPGLRNRKIRAGTDDISRGPAMTKGEARRSVEIGIEVFAEEWSASLFDVAVTGEMGIGNTTPSSAIVSAYSGVSPRLITGRGTGVNDAALERKIAIVQAALSVNKPDPKDALDVLSKVGGFEIGAMAGTMLAAASRGIPVMIDGFISSAAAMIARGLCPFSVEYMIAGHRSVEPGQKVALEILGLQPILDLGMRLGEGTGAALAAMICRAACKAHAGMSTFEEAGVSSS